MKKMKNILTVDLEDWHSLVQRRLTGHLPGTSPILFRQMDRLLQLLDSYNTKATFFVLGAVAEHQPDLVKSLAASGHEIASHGYAHIPIYRLTPEQFREDTRKSKQILEDLIGSEVSGYRAALFSIIKDTLWALDILAEEGFQYDSSIFPVYHHRYGIPGFCPHIQSYPLRNNLSIIEIPPSVTFFGKIPLPIAGGGYFRFMPLWFLKAMTGKLVNSQYPFVIYMHPYEIDTQPLNIFDFYQPDKWHKYIVGHRYNFFRKMGCFTTHNKLEYLIKNYNFVPCSEYLSKSNSTQLSGINMNTI